MKHFLKYSLLFCAIFVLCQSVFADGKKGANKPAASGDHGSNPAVVIVGSAAKGTWAVTKFTAKNVAKPVAKAVLLKATPAMTKFVLKTTAKNALPLVLKLSVL